MKGDMCTILRRWALCALLSTFGVLPGRGEEQAAVLSISSVTEQGFRERVVTDLVQRYDCCVLSRSLGYDLAVEQDIGRIGALGRLFPGDAELPAATHVVGLQIDSWKEKHGTGVMWIQPLVVNDAPEIEKRFAESSVASAQELVVAMLGSALTLHPRKAPAVAAAGDRGLTWAIMPVMRADHSDVHRAANPALGEGLAVQVEAALQEARPADKLVSHREIESVLKELAQKDLLASGQNAGGIAARLLHADRTLLITVSRWQGADAYRVDMHAVDAQTAAVIDAEAAYSRDWNGLRSSAAGAAVRLVGRGRGAYRIPASTEAQRKNEAEFYLRRSRSGWSIEADNPNWYRHVVAMVESGFLLARRDPGMAKALRTGLMQALQGCVREVRYTPAVTKPTVRRAQQMLEDVIRTAAAADRALPPSVPLLRAELHLALGEYTQAVACAEECARADLHGEAPQARLVQAWVHAKMGRVKEAESILNRLVSEHGKHFVVWPTPWTLKSDDDDGPLREVLLRQKADKLPDTARYAAIGERLRNESYAKVEDWAAYVDLLRRIEGPAKTVEQLDIWLRREEWDRAGLGWRAEPAFDDDWNMRTVEIECLTEMGRHEEAARNSKILLQLPLAGMRGPCPALVNRATKVASTVIARVEKESGPVDILWRSAGDTRRIPEAYAIYMIPVGEIALSHVRTIATNASRFFGIPMRILKRMPMPTGSLDAQSTRVNRQRLWEGSLRQARIPRDALFVVFLDDQPAGVYSQNEGNPLLCSAGDLFHERALCWKSKDIARSLWYSYARKVPEDVMRQRLPRGQPALFPYWAIECRDTACLFAERPSFEPYCTFLMCPDCQAEYQRVDFAKIQASLMECLKKAGSTIIDTADGEMEPLR